MVTMKLTGQGWNRYSVCPNIRIRLNMLQTEQRHGRRFLVAYAKRKVTTRLATCSQVIGPSKRNGTKKQKIITTQESVNITKGGGDDEVMVNAGDALETTGQEEKMVGVNGRAEGVKVNARVRQVQHVRPPNKRKKSERIIKMKLAKNMGGEGSSRATAMDLD
ncbi:unnamed protein product [Lactuca virosa]|uniref:Uncharacterized protein n=1 Tax=Lactuca virosa TaxID=75947 RepID=A0AAU9LGI4_9ASTR|nr:unnamed protein product [Lactuca virosa]